MSTLLIISIPLAPLVGALLAAFGPNLYAVFSSSQNAEENGDNTEGEKININNTPFARKHAHWVTILSVAWSLLASVFVGWHVIENGAINFNAYLWAGVDGMAVGFLVDNLSAMMMIVVTFVSLMVHIYTIGYMAHDSGYCRFFAYISFFTFAMLMLVMANNFLQLFFGWEAVGLASYLLIGFWYQKPTATYANLKAFMVNRVGDLGFLLGIGLVLAVFGSLDYAHVFSNTGILENATPDTVPALSALPLGWDMTTTICILLFIGAMGKSAQFPLHVWLPDSMEGPTPISALIHAATMVTAGIFMVSRMSPLFEMSETALNVVLCVGAITAFFMGILGLVQNDIKRVVAYSTLSQLGYMTAALGASAYSAAVFHLFTHAFFKALLFLGAGSVIIAMHHEQDMRKMGGLRRYMPLTYWTVVIGSLALVGIPPFSGFFSKDAIIEAVAASQLPAANIAHIGLLIGAFITALYSFRLLFLAFHGYPRADAKVQSHIKESPFVVTGPLLLLAIPSMLAGGFLVEWMLFGDFFADSIFVLPEHDTVAAVRDHANGQAVVMLQHAISNPAMWAGLSGTIVALIFYLKWPPRTKLFTGNFVHRILLDNYGFDRFNDWFFARGARAVGTGLWKQIDAGLIDGFFVNGSAKFVAATARLIRNLQSGAIYHYAFLMLFAVGLILLWRLS